MLPDNFYMEPVKRQIYFLTKKQKTRYWLEKNTATGNVTAWLKKAFYYMAGDYNACLQSLQPNLAEGTPYNPYAYSLACLPLVKTGQPGDVITTQEKIYRVTSLTQYKRQFISWYL
jgi:hypothetical protein